TAALDVRHQLTVLDLLRRTARDQGIVVAAALHDLSLAAIYANHVVCRVDAAGPATEVLTAARLRRVYRVEAELTRGADGRPRVTPLRAV
ncbi:MAG: ABC transporter ATP-binding protein, partial [Pseudomonadota bacterium]|nr:ABC transporter ATP-binding protein [Pseudomonadota bacterium]